jgi:hypothetical protein
MSGVGGVVKVLRWHVHYLADGAAWLLMLQYTRSIYQKYGIAQSAYVAQGFSPVTFRTGTDGAMGTVAKKRR